jgi:hypothetical protein
VFGGLEMAISPGRSEMASMVASRVKIFSSPNPSIIKLQKKFFTAEFLSFFFFP